MFLLCFLIALEFFCNPKLWQSCSTTVCERKTLTGLYPSLVIPMLSKGQEQLQKASSPWSCVSTRVAEIPLLWGSAGYCSVWFAFTKALFGRRQFVSKASSFETCKGSTPQALLVLFTIPVILLSFCHNHAGWIPRPHTILVLVYKKDQINQCRLDFILGNSWR